MAKPRGSVGTWFAEWNSEQLPCVHKHWLKAYHYCDPGVSSDAKWPPFIDAIRDGKRVIVTDDYRSEDGKPTGRRERYIAVYRIDNVEVRDNALHFDLVDKLEEFEN
jgi:hypothetical protein